MKLFLCSLFVYIFLIGCQTPEKVIVEEPKEVEVEYTIRKILKKSTDNTCSNIAKANRNKLLSILPEQQIDSVMAYAGLNEIESYYKKDQLNNIVANSVEQLYEDILMRIDLMDIEHGEMIIMNPENSITNLFARSHYEYLESKLTEYLIKEGNRQNELKALWSEMTNQYNAKNDYRNVETRLPHYLAEPTLNYIFQAISEHETSIRNNINSLGDATAKRVFDFYVERYVYGDYQFD